MKFYFAPMEGITGYIFRNAYQKHYGNIDKYFAPFISPADHCPINPKEKRDIHPDHNQGISVIPQILTSKSQHFMECCDELTALGYKEINLNLGCPSGTVCAKRKGAGFLSETDDLIKFLETIYNYGDNHNIDISIKTRIGRYDPEEWEYLLEIYNRYPVSELIVHPRIREDYYKVPPRMEYMEYTRNNTQLPIVYNGNLFTLNSIKEVADSYSCLMLGRGLLYQPELIEAYQNNWDHINLHDVKRFRLFHDELYHNYQEIMAPDINVLFRMKELWTYFRELFPNQDKTIKKILKSKKYAEYDSLVRELM